MWVSSMTSPHTNGATYCGGQSQSITQNLPNRRCSQCRLAPTTMHNSNSNNNRSSSLNKMSASSSSSLSSAAWNGMQHTLHRAIYVFAAIILLNTVGLFSVALADTMQYPVTASIGGSLIPPGKDAHLFTTYYILVSFRDVQCADFILFKLVRAFIGWFFSSPIPTIIIDLTVFFSGYLITQIPVDQFTMRTSILSVVPALQLSLFIYNFDAFAYAITVDWTSKAQQSEIVVLFLLDSARFGHFAILPCHSILQSRIKVIANAAMCVFFQ